MYASMMLFTLTLAAPTDSPNWSTEYSAARQQGESAGKPLAIFIGSGARGWEKISRNGLVAETNELLAANYVCVYIDTATEKGKSLATAFDIPDGLGIVISDRTGKLQAFYHAGDLAREDLDRYLRRFADPRLVVRSTESNPGNERRSYYGPAAGGCPNGRCPR